MFYTSSKFCCDYRKDFCMTNNINQTPTKPIYPEQAKPKSAPSELPELYPEQAKPKSAPSELPERPLRNPPASAPATKL
jgi:hypothetical protein